MYFILYEGFKGLLKKTIKGFIVIINSFNTTEEEKSNDLSEDKKNVMKQLKVSRPISDCKRFK